MNSSGNSETRAFRAATAVLLFSAVFAACSGGRRLPEESVVIGNATFILEVARTPEEQRTGLMHRKRMDADRGMIFVFPEDRKLSFWMKDTLIPLSIAYVDSSGTIREIHDMEPLSLRPVESAVSVRYAIELNRGAFAVAGVGPGSRIDLPTGLLR